MKNPLIQKNYKVKITVSHGSSMLINIKNQNNK